MSSPSGASAEAVANLGLACDDCLRAASFIPHRPRPLTVDEALAKVRGWISHCNAAHPKCNPRAHPQPARLLDVADPDTVVLVDTNPDDVPLLYVAPSYCWGPSSASLRQVRTLRENMASHRRGIPNASLPKSVGDAIRVSRSVRCRHIWIDALCIVQDDDEDRAPEISRMGYIYTYSHFTLVAAGAADCAQGFLGIPLERHA